MDAETLVGALSASEQAEIARCLSSEVMAMEIAKRGWIASASGFSSTDRTVELAQAPVEEGGADFAKYVGSALLDQLGVDRESTGQVDRRDRDTIIEELNIGVRTYQCLVKAGVRTVAELTSLSDADLLARPNLGKKTLKEIHEALELYRQS